MFWKIIIYQSFINKLSFVRPDFSTKHKVLSEAFPVYSTASLQTDEQEKLQQLQQSYVLIEPPQKL